MPVITITTIKIMTTIITTILMTVEAVTVFLSRALVVSGDVRDDAHSDSNF